MLVASDALTRGMDVAGVGAVVNYDAPTFAKTYVHRAGRTARAGQHGKFSLLKWFWQHRCRFSIGLGTKTCVHRAGRTTRTGQHGGSLVV